MSIRPQLPLERPRPRIAMRSLARSAMREVGTSAADAADAADAARHRRAVAASLAALLAPLVLTAVLAYPVLIQPLLAPPPPPSAIADFIPPATDGDSGLFNKIYFPVLACLATVTLLMQHGTALAARLRDPAVAILALLCLWIVATSVIAVEPEIALRRALLQVTIIVAIGGAVIAAASIGLLIDMAGAMLAIALLVNLAAVLTQSPTALGYAGIYSHKNQLGECAVVAMAVAVLWAATAGGWRRVAAVVMMAIAIGLIVAARSKTSLAMALAIPPSAVAVALAARLARISPAVAVVGAAASAWFVYSVGVEMRLWDFHSAASALFGDPTLTQRTDIWAFALKMIPDRLITGYGFEVFWGAGPESPSIRQGPGFVAKMPHAHNGYIDLVLQTGLIGLALVLTLLLVSLHRVGRIARQDLGMASGLLAIVLLALLYNLLESAWMRTFNVMWVSFLAAALLIGRLGSPGAAGRSPGATPWRA